MIVLLPPSEGKAPGGSPRSSWNPAAGSTGRALGAMRGEIAAALSKAGGGSQALLGVKGQALEKAKETNTALSGARTLPAWQRYTGVVWGHLDLGSMTATARERALRSVLVPSGLMGLVRADDPVPDYKLKMGASLPRLGRISSFWRDAITEELLRLADGDEIIDLLPQEHRAAFDWSRVDGVVRLDLVSRSGGAVGGHNAKAAKGLLARHLLSARAGNAEKRAAGFAHGEYAVRVTR